VVEDSWMLNFANEPKLEIGTTMLAFCPFINNTARPLPPTYKVLLLSSTVPVTVTEV
jgi:hypothetical protein